MSAQLIGHYGRLGLTLYWNGKIGVTLAGTVSGVTFLMDVDRVERRIEAGPSGSYIEDPAELAEIEYCPLV